MAKRSAYRVLSLIIDKLLGVSKKDNQIRAIKMVTNKRYEEALEELQATTRLINRHKREKEGGEK